MTESASQRFDRVIGTLDGLPDVRSTRPTTVRSVLPIVNESSTHIIQTFRTPDGFIVFLETMDASGHVRVVLPAAVSAAIYRQRQSLTDRSTPESRARRKAAKERERKRAEREQRKEAWRQRQASK